jgi:hypothetical protein
MAGCPFFILTACVQAIIATGCERRTAVADVHPSLVKIDMYEFREPPAGERPWVRWWWPGNDVEDDELRRELGALAMSYFGGAEIQAFDSALNPDPPAGELARRRSVDTPPFFDHIAAVLMEARNLGLQIDLTLGSGWPTGGMHITPEKSLKMLAWSEEAVRGPGKAALRLDAPDEPPFYQLAALLGGGGKPMARFMPEYAALVAVIAARVTGGARTSSPLDFTDQIELDPASVTLLTDMAGPGGELVWDVPEGDWIVVAVFGMPDGECPMMGASAECGFVLDHFNETEVTGGLEHFLGGRTGLEKFHGRPLRAFFVDSFEMKTERFFTGDFFQEFIRRRGYDPVPLLPLVLIPGADNSLFDGLGAAERAPFRLGGQDGRVQYDYQLTASELFIERFIDASRRWADGRGLQSRMQTYGLNIDVIRAAGGVSMPETEQLYAGGPDVFLKIISSGGHLYGRNIVSAESLVWPLRDYTLTPSLMRAGVNKLFSAGVNQIVFHGFPYRLMEGYGETGWDAFSSPFWGPSTYAENFSETNPFWPEMAEINRYISRCQHLLRLGEPEADILAYYPWLGFPASFFRLPGYWEPLFYGRISRDDPLVDQSAQNRMMTEIFGGPDMSGRLGWVRRAGEGLVGAWEKGYSWDWANEHSLLEAVVIEGRIAIRGRTYKALVLHDIEALSPDLAERLAFLAESGAKIIISGDKPARQPGFFNFVEGDRRVSAAVERILKTVVFSGEAENPGDLATILTGAGVEPGIRFSGSSGAVHHQRRRLGPGSQIIFLSNSTGSVLEEAVSVSEGCVSPVWLDPWTGKAHAAGPGAANPISLRLEDFEAGILACGIETGGDLMPVSKPFSAAEKIPVTGWMLSVESDDVAGGKVETALNDMAGWPELDVVRYSGGPGLYRAAVTMPEVRPGRRVFLSLGRVEGSAHVSWNGEPVRNLLVSPFAAEITPLIRAGANTVEVLVKVPLRNRLVGKWLAGDRQYSQFSGKENTLAPAGLLGPVEVLIGD